MSPAPNIENLKYLLDLQRKLQECAHGDKKAVVARAVADLGIGQNTIYARLRDLRPGQCPLASNRKRRHDSGQRDVQGAELASVSAALLASYRRNGKRIMTFENAVQMLRDNGVITTGLSSGRIATILTEKGLHPDQLTRPTPAIEQRSLHPNHVWQVDASVCVAYYLSNATGLQVMDEKKFNKNKPANLTRIQEERLIRYALADHFSHEVLTRYYLGSECSAHLADFLIWCFAPKTGHVVHGVPFILQMDMGSANTSKPVLNMLDRLSVRHIIHERHNSRANGSVEKANHLVEVNFESSLRFARIAGLDDLNAKALTWSNWFGANALHTRHGRTRHDVWLTITAEQLCLAPAMELLRTLPTSSPVKRRVSNNLTIDFAVRGHGSYDYDIRHLPGVLAGSNVPVVVNAMLAPAVEVAYPDQDTGELRWMTFHPTARDEVGFRLDAPIIGEQLRTAPRGLLDKNRDDVMQRAFGGTTPEEAAKAQENGALAFGGRVDPFKRAAEAKLPAYIPKRGTPLEVPGRKVEEARISVVMLCKQVREALHRAGHADAYPRALYADLSKQYGPQGVPQDQVAVIVRDLLAAEAAATAQRKASGQ